jgi:tetratricopeptide (TPR) repeat protein
MTQRLPKRSRAHVLETLSIQRVQSILPAEWICTSIHADYGLDMRVEIVSGEQVTGLEFSIQLKATDHLKTSGDDVLHRCKVSTAQYFLRRPEPVMYVLYDAQGDIAYWLWVQPYLRELDKNRRCWRDQQTTRIRIPRSSQLTRQSIPIIADAVEAWWGRVAPTVGWEYAPSPRVALHPLQLPPDLFTFTGRDEYMVKLDKLLQPGVTQTVGLVGLRGMAGVGKSALAVHAAHRWGDRFRDGVVWVDLRQRDVPSALYHIAATYGYGDQAAQEPSLEGLAALVRTVLSGRQALIILDNAEKVPPDHFSLLVPGVTGCVTLVTSRRYFAELGRYGQMLHVKEMSEDESKTLLTHILGASADDTDEAARNNLVERLGGLPLALDIAARRMAERRWSVAEYLARLNEAVDVAAELSLPFASQSEESVALAFSLSYENLDEGHQSLFRALSMMADGGFAPASVAGVLGGRSAEVERTLEEMAALALVRSSEVPDRYELHPLLTDYSCTLARQAGEWERLRNAHLKYYVDYAQQHIHHHPALEAEVANMMAAAEWSAKTGQHEDICQLSDALCVQGRFMPTRGHYGEALRVLTWATEAARALGWQRELGRYLGNLGVAYRRLGQARQAIQRHRTALEIARQSKDQWAEAKELHRLAIAHHRVGDESEAINYCEQAVKIMERVGARKDESECLSTLGNSYRHLGEVQTAIDHFERALVIAREDGDRREEGASLGNLGHCYRNLGDVQRSLVYYQQALGIAREVRDRFGEASRLGSLGLIYHRMGQIEIAIDHYEQALEISREIGDRRGVGIRLGSLGNAYRDLEQMETAVAYLEQALDIAREIHDRRGEGIRLSSLAEVHISTGHPRKAIEYVEQSLAIAREIGHRHGEGYRLVTLGQAYRALGETKEPVACFDQALNIAREIGDRRLEGKALRSTGAMYASLGHIREARGCLESALAVYESIRSPEAERIRGWLKELAKEDVA